MLLSATEVILSPREPGGLAQDVRGTGLILVIDDEEIVLKTTRAILERHGYRVLTATTVGWEWTRSENIKKNWRP